MPTTFRCKCGKVLQAKDELADKRVRCPACGRLLVVSRPKSWLGTFSESQIDASPAAAEAAQEAGVVGRGRGSVVRLHAAGVLQQDVRVSGEVSCRFCQAKVSFEGQVFGRPGLGGTLADIHCPSCRTKIWLGYSSHATADNTNIFVYAPSMTRDFRLGDDEKCELPSPTLEITRPPTPAPAAEVGSIKALLERLLKAIQGGEMYRDVLVHARTLVLARLTPADLKKVRAALRILLKNENRTYVMAVLTEALAALRDETAGGVVQAALHRALAAEDIRDRDNLPLQDLCLLTLLFRNRSGFLDAVNRGMPRSNEPTRALKLGKALPLDELIELVKEGGHIDGYESTFGGEERLFIYTLQTNLDTEEKASGLLGRLFGSLKKGAGKKAT